MVTLGLSVELNAMVLLVAQTARHVIGRETAALTALHAPPGQATQATHLHVRQTRSGKMKKE
jgi:hypothetical protein